MLGREAPGGLKTHSKSNHTNGADMQLERSDTRTELSEVLRQESEKVAFHGL